jgi:hypothetical protein
MRYQCAAAAIIRAGCIRALQKLDGDVRLVSTKLARPKLPEETRNYFSREASKRKKARAEFEEFGISVAEVLATAAQLNSEPLQLFENMIRWRASHCRKVSKKARARTKPAAKPTGGIDLNGKLTSRSRQTAPMPGRVPDRGRKRADAVQLKTRCAMDCRSRRSGTRRCGSGRSTWRTAS